MSYNETTNPADIENLADIKYLNYGMAIGHNMPCCVYPKNNPAVLDTDKGVFCPSWSAQLDGWALVQYNKDATWLTKFVFELVRKRMFRYS